MRRTPTPPPVHVLYRMAIAEYLKKRGGSGNNRWSSGMEDHSADALAEGPSPTREMVLVELTSTRR